MIIPNFTGSLQDRMADLNDILSGRSDIRLVGSSFGGLMASLFALDNESRVQKMILLAPAINLPEFATHKSMTISLPVRIYHGRNDRIIPLVEIEPVSRQVFTNLSLHIVDDDHFLHKTFKSIDWDNLLA